MAWACDECGEIFDQSDHITVACKIPEHAEFVVACTCRPDILNRATTILVSEECRLRYAEKHPELFSQMLSISLILNSMDRLHRKRAEQASRN